MPEVMIEIPSQEGREFDVFVSPLQRDIRYNREFWRGKKMFSILSLSSPIPFSRRQSIRLLTVKKEGRERKILSHFVKRNPSFSPSTFSDSSPSLFIL